MIQKHFIHPTNTTKCLLCIDSWARPGDTKFIKKNQFLNANNLQPREETKIQSFPNHVIHDKVEMAEEIV